MADDDRKHTEDVYSLEPGEEVRLITDEGDEFDVRVGEKRQHHDESGPHITQQTNVDFERLSDGVTLKLGKTNGLSGIEDADPFPSYFPLFSVDDSPTGGRVPEEFQYGYVERVEQSSPSVWCPGCERNVTLSTWNADEGRCDACLREEA